MQHTWVLAVIDTAEFDVMTSIWQENNFVTST